MKLLQPLKTFFLALVCRVLVFDVHGHPSSRHNMSGGARTFYGSREGNGAMVSAHVDHSFSLIEKRKTPCRPKRLHGVDVNHATN